MSERLSLDEKIARARVVPDIAGREPFEVDIVKTHLALAETIVPVNTLREAVMSRGNPDEILDVASQAIISIIGVALSVAEPRVVAEAVKRAGTLFQAPNRESPISPKQ